MPDTAVPALHYPDPDRDADTLVRALLDGPGPRAEGARGIHVVVRVEDGGNVAHAQVHDPASSGHGARRWLEHARRGSSPGGWVGDATSGEDAAAAAWRDEHAATVDRALIDCCRQAWRLEAAAPYVVDFGRIELPQPGS